jgi:hypothetical protein
MVRREQMRLAGHENGEQTMNSPLNSINLVVEINGRFFITMGYNSPVNNRKGYASINAATAASLRYGKK